MRQFTLQSRGASTCSATNEVCQYYQSALCGSNFLVCCVLLWPRMPQLLATTVFGLQGRFDLGLMSLLPVLRA